MNLKAIATVVTSKVGRQVLKVQKNSPALLFGAGVVGIVATVVLASRATLKLEQILETHEKDLANVNEIEQEETEYQKDLVYVYTKTSMAVVKAYGPAVLLGVASIASLTSGHVILNRRYLAVTAAYAALDKGWRQYRDRVIAELGEDRERDIRYDARKIEIEPSKDGKKAKTEKQVGPFGGSVYAVMFDEENKNWERRPSHNQMFIQCQQNYANDLLQGRGHIFLNEVYDMLGMPRTPAGAVVGWLKDGNGDNFVDFGVIEGDRYSGQRFINGDEPSVLLDFNVDGMIYNDI